MTVVTADSLGIANDGSAEVSTALENGANALSSGDTFQLHANGSYLSNTEIRWTKPGVIIDGQDATVFSNVRRGIINPPGSGVRWQVVLTGPNMTLRNLRKYGYRSDVYTGNKLVVVAGTPSVNLTTMVLNNQDDEVRLPPVPLDWTGPTASGSYHSSETPFYFRDRNGNVKFSASVQSSTGAGPFVFAIVDDSNSAVLFSQQFDPVGSPNTFTITWPLPIANLGTRLRITLRKVSAIGTITINSVTAFGEAGYRNYKGNQYTGGDEFSHGFAIESGANITIEDCWSEGPDGDNFNMASAGDNAIVRRCTGRCSGRQGIVVADSTGLLLEDITEREVGRSGCDFEPNPGLQHSSFQTTLRRVSFINVRNYTIAMGKDAQINTVIMSDITSLNAGMGPWFGGATIATVSRFHHTNTYRAVADQIANGGAAGADAILYGINMNFTDFTTDIGFYLAGPPTTWLPRPESTDIHVAQGRVTNPVASPPYVIEAPNSSVEIISGAPAPSKVWDDTTVFWDDPLVTWDGLIVGAPPPPPPPPVTGTFRLKRSIGGSKLKGTDRLKGGMAPAVSRLFRLKRLAGGSRLKAAAGGDRLKFGSVPVVSLYGKITVTNTLRGTLAPKITPHGKVLVTNTLTGTPYKVKYARGTILVTNTLRGTALATTPAVQRYAWGKVQVTNTVSALTPIRTANARGKVQVTNTLTARAKVRRGPQPGDGRSDVVRLGQIDVKVGVGS